MEKVGLKLNIQKTKIMESGPITSWQIDGETVTEFIFLGSKITADAAMKLKMLVPWKKSHDQPRQHVKKHRHYFINKGPSSQSFGFSSSLVWMWELDYKESWVLKNWCFWTVILEKTLESSLDCKDIQPVHPKENQSWVFIGRTDVEAETPVLWPPHTELTHWKRPWRWEGLGAGGKGKDRGWDSWMASPTQWTWVWVDSRSWWWTGRPGMLRFMGSQRVGHDWATELNWTEEKKDLISKQLPFLTCLVVPWKTSFKSLVFIQTWTLPILNTWSEEASI